MSFHITHDGDVALLEVDGELIVGNRESLKELIVKHLDAGDRKFVMDFSASSYIDSSGLGALVSLSRKIRESGGRLRIAGLNDDLRTLFQLTKLDTLFEIVDSRSTALADF